MSLIPWNAPLTVNTSTNAAQTYPTIAQLNDGSMVVTWTDLSSGNADIKFQRYVAAGNKLGGETLAHVANETAALERVLLHSAHTLGNIVLHSLKRLNFGIAEETDPNVRATLRAAHAHALAAAGHRDEVLGVLRELREGELGARALERVAMHAGPASVLASGLHSEDVPPYR